MGKLHNRIAIVSGASGGIGLGIAKTYAKQGAKVCLAARNVDALEAGVAEIRDAGGDAIAVPMDVTCEDDVVEAFQTTMKTWGRIDVAVNNAGIAGGGPTEDLELATWRRVIDVNVTGVFLCCREALRHMIPHRRGRIINIGSVAAKVPRPASAPYATSKFALDGLTRSVALDARPHGIAVSVLHPGNTATAMLIGVEERAEHEGYMQPEDVAEVAVTMASLPDSINFLESVVLPITMPLIGRG